MATINFPGGGDFQSTDRPFRRRRPLAEAGWQDPDPAQLPLDDRIPTALTPPVVRPDPTPPLPYVDRSNPVGGTRQPGEDYQPGPWWTGFDEPNGPVFLPDLGLPPAVSTEPPTPRPPASWQPSFTNLVQDYWAPDRREALLRELTLNYHAPDRAAVIDRYQNMSERELWPNGRPGSGTTTGARWDDAWFRANIGTPNTLAELVAFEPQIRAAGGQLNRNASGQWNGKITTPDGRIVDVMIAAGLGGRALAGPPPRGPARGRR